MFSILIGLEQFYTDVPPTELQSSQWPLSQLNSQSSRSRHMFNIILTLHQSPLFLIMNHHDISRQNHAIKRHPMHSYSFKLMRLTDPALVTTWSFLIGFSTRPCVLWEESILEGVDAGVLGPDGRFLQNLSLSSPSFDAYVYLFPCYMFPFVMSSTPTSFTPIFIQFHLDYDIVCFIYR